jgi:molybdate transport system substrate-binding protein
LSAFGPVQGSVRSESILVSAASSLAEALREIGDSYQSKSMRKVVFAFGSSSLAARQIEQGAPADLFFSADATQMDRLERSGLIEPGTRRNLLSNQLVLIVPAASRLATASPEDLLRPEVKRIAVAEPSSVPVGVYARRYLQARGLWAKLEPKVVPVLDARAALATVESGNVEAGFVYKTDAAISKKVKVVFEVPIETGPEIVYPAAIVRESKKKEAARDFMNFVSSPAAKESFRKSGFVVLE